MDEVVLEDVAADHPDARACVEAYFAELDRRFEHGFDPGRALAGPPGDGVMLLARLRGEPVGCGIVKRVDAATAEIKRLWVAAAARGHGLGRRLLAELERRARDGGAKVVRLDSNRTLVEAIALYRATGYVEVPAFNREPHAHHWFEKPL